MLDILRELCRLNGVSGWEDSVRHHIRKLISDCSDDIFEDAAGNLFVHKPGRKRREKTLMVCAHMDEVGMMIKGITDDGFLKFAFIGGVDRRVAMGKRVRVGISGIPGVIGVKAIHLTTKEERKNVPKIEELYIDIGAKSRSRAEKYVEPGDVAAFDSDYTEFGDGMIKAKALDDRIGCAAMVKLISEPLEYDTWFVFTAQEEVGLRGAAVAAYSLNPHSALVLEGTTAADIPDVTGHKQVCRLGDGPVVGCADFSTLYDRDYFELLKNLADGLKTPWQIKRLVAGGTDAGIIHTSRRGVKTAGISVPVRYIHSPSCVAAKTDINHALTLAAAFINHEMSGGNDRNS